MSRQVFIKDKRYIQTTALFLEERAFRQLMTLKSSYIHCTRTATNIDIIAFGQK